jgi:WD40 repeat protein
MNTPTRLKQLALSVFLLSFFSAVTNFFAQRPELVVQAGHRNMVRSLAISRDSQWIASGGADKTIIIWEVGSGKQLLSLAGHKEWIFALAFSSDKKFLASGSYDGEVKVWNLVTAKIEYEIDSVKPFGITSLEFSPDNQNLVIASAGKTIDVWDMKAGKMTAPLRGHTDKVTQVSFHKDGKTLISSSADGTTRFWDFDARTSKPTDKFEIGVAGATYSPSGRMFAITLENGTIGILNDQPRNVAAYIKPQRIPENNTKGLDYRRMRRVFGTISAFMAGATAFISDQKLAFIDGFNLRIWDIAKDNLALTKEIESSRGGYSVVASPDGSLLAYADGNDIKLLNLTDSSERTLHGGFAAFDGTVFSSNGRAVLGTFAEGYKLLGDELLAEPEDLYSMMSRTRDKQAVYIASRKVIARPGKNGKIDLFDFIASKVVDTIQGHTKTVNSLTVDKKGTLLASCSEDGTIKVWDLKTLQLRHTLNKSSEHIQLSSDGRFLALKDSSDSMIKILDLGNLQAPPISVEGGDANIMLFNPDNTIFATLSVHEGGLWKFVLYKVSDGKMVDSFDHDATPELFGGENFRSIKISTEPNASALFGLIKQHPNYSGSLAFDPTNKDLIAYSEIDRSTGSNLIKIRNFSEKREVRALAGHAASIRSLAFSPNRKILASASWDGTVKLWNSETGENLATFVPFDKDEWVVFTSDGRFNTNLDFETLSRLNWIWPADPFKPLSIRVFIRDYFDPNLLGKILTTEPLKEIRDISNLNRTQPAVRITDVKPDSSSTVQITVEVSNVSSAAQKDANGRPLESGVYDVRVFRDRHMVAVSTPGRFATDRSAQTADLTKSRSFDSAELDIWRKAAEVKLTRDGKANLIFNGVKVPRAGIKQVTFSAYAFNGDRVTSETSTYRYQLQAVQNSVKPRAYVITMGVDANQSGSSWSLDLAAESSGNMQKLLSGKLSRNYEVIGIPLISTFEPESPRAALKDATKKNIQNVLNILAGKDVPRESRLEIPNGNALARATPDDLIVLYIASHGYSDPNNNFYVIPYDTGQNVGTTELSLNNCLNGQNDRSANCESERNFIKNAISAEDWIGLWHDVDAGQMIMILDSCYSSTLMSGRDFKPGPLGDESFAQLSYDKGIILLAASQKMAIAAKRSGFNGTLLSETLMDISKKQPEASLLDLFETVRTEVPQRYRILYPDENPEPVQIPTLFNFAGKK